MMSNRTTEEFITLANLTHKGRYTYEYTKYEKSNSHVTITCHLHGNFEQRPDGHLAGKGCKLCANLNQRKTREQFIKEIEIVHSGKYDYSKVEYKTGKDFITITCKEHGDFIQRARKHLGGNPCPKCSRKSANLNKCLKEDEFIERAVQIHGNKYTYSNYSNGYTKINITCPKHGEFLQIPHSHLNGSGCDLCARESNRYSYKSRCLVPDFANKQGIVYAMKLNIGNESFGKIGVSVNFKARLQRYKSEGVTLEVVETFPMKAIDSLQVEEKVLKFLIDNNYKYLPQSNFGGRTECFHMQYFPEILDFLKSCLEVV